MSWTRPLALAATLAVTGVGFAQEAPPVDRYLLVVANNASIDPSLEPLRYADDDAGRYYELLSPGTRDAHLLVTFDSESAPLFEALGGVARPPTRDNLLGALDDLGSEIAQSQAEGHETELTVIFSGHGGIDDDQMGYLSLLDSPWTQADMVSHVIAPQHADFTHLVIDACNAFYMVQGRGWQDDTLGASAEEAVAGYLSSQEVLSRYPHVGVFLSTVGAQEVFEWGHYRAGVFSHQLRSGLVGAADVDGDGLIRYDELAAYVAAANAAVLNPSARIRVTASGPQQQPTRPFVALGDIEDPVVLAVPAGDPGLFVIEDDRGLRFADIATAGDRDLQIVLPRHPARTYYLRHDGEEARIEVDAFPSGVATTSLAWTPVLTASRSAVTDAFRTSLFTVPFSRAFFDGYLAAMASVPLVESVRVHGQPAPTTHLDIALDGGIGLVDELHSEALTLRYGRERGAYLAVRLEHGVNQPNARSSGDRTRYTLGLGGGYRIPIGERWALGAETTLGNVWAVDAEGQDPTGIRVSARSMVSYALSHRIALNAGIGTGWTLLSYLDQGDEQYELTQAGDVDVHSSLGLRVRF